MFNQNKYKNLLEKINWLSKSFEQNEFKNISALEKSLLKEKVLMLFDEIENMATTAFESKSDQPTANSQQSAANSQQPIANSQQPATSSQQPAASSQQPTANSQPPTKEEKFKKTEQFQKEIAMPKRDIREIIDLNKSFILKAELFNQNNDLYNSFIQEINETRTELAAETVVKNWTQKLSWQTEENKAYELLTRAVEKRFLPLLS